MHMPNWDLLVALVVMLFNGWLTFRSSNKWMRSVCGVIAGAALCYILLAPVYD